MISTSSETGIENDAARHEGPSSNDIKIRTLLVDDQPSGISVLRNILRFEPDIEIIGTAANGLEAIESINRLAPELVFLDVQMPGVDGFGVVAKIELPKSPIIIFVTARDDCALKGFEAHALDYVLKPCQPSRIQSAVERARQQIKSQNHVIHQKLDNLIQGIKGDTKYFRERLAVKSDGRIIFLRLADIDMVEAADNYVKVCSGKETYLLRETLTAVEEKLPTDRFIRISRSAIVNLESVKELHPLFHGEYAVALKNGARPTLTRGYREQLQQFGISPRTEKE